MFRNNVLPLSSFKYVVLYIGTYSLLKNVFLSFLFILVMLGWSPLSVLSLVMHPPAREFDDEDTDVLKLEAPFPPLILCSATANLSCLCGVVTSQMTEIRILVADKPYISELVRLLNLHLVSVVASLEPARLRTRRK